MFEFLIHHKKTIMTYTLWLIIPSFIVFYGIGECSKPQQYRWVAKVNGEEIREAQWRNRMDNLRSQNTESFPDEDSLRSQALSFEIVTELVRQKSEEWGLGTTDGEIKTNIRNSQTFKDENGNFIGNEQYQQLLINNGIHPIIYEENQRFLLTQDKVRTVGQNAFANAATDKQRNTDRRNLKSTIEFLAFTPAEYTDEVEVDEAGLNAFFEENKENYEIPEQRKITYVEFKPAAFQNQMNDLISDATTYQRLLERYFEQNQPMYEIPDQVRVERLTYNDANFVDEVELTEDEAKEYYEANKSKYQSEERVKARYVYQPLAALAEQQNITAEAVADYYEKNKFRYEHDDQVKARHILMRVRNTAPASELSAVKEKIESLKEEIINGLDFSEAAREHSDDTVSAAQGGDLGYFDRAQMVPEFSEVAFSLPLGQVSDPFQTSYGYHILIVDDNKEAGTDTLDEVRDDIEDTLQKQMAVAKFREKAQALESLEDSGYEIHETDWIVRGESIEGIPDTDRLYFSSSAFLNLPDRKINFSGNQITQNLYMIETTERQIAQPLTFDQARDDVFNDAKLANAGDVARQAAESDIAKILSASVALETIATERDLQILPTQLFGRGDQFVQGLGSNPIEIINRAMVMNVGEVDGPFITNTGIHIIRLLAREPAHLPELAEVESQVNQDFIKAKTIEWAKAAANSFADQVYASEKPLADGAIDEGLTSTTTDFFKSSDPIGDLGNKTEINTAVFDLEKVGDISLAIETLQGMSRPGAQQEVDAYYIAQLDDIKEEYIPALDEVREDVEEDYKLKLAEDVVIAKANEVLEKIKQEVSQSPPISATQTIELEDFSDVTDTNVTGEKIKYYKSFDISGNGSTPGGYRSLELAKTALELEPGKISSTIISYNKKLDDNGKLVNDTLQGVFIVQVLGKPIVEEEVESQSQISNSQIEKFLEQRTQQMAFSAWITEVSATANIEYNLEVIKPELDDEEDESLDS